jgi:hypothetical protein
MGRKLAAMRGPGRELLGCDHLAGGGWTRVTERVLTRKPLLIVYSLPRRA